jgi:DNA mismatch repair protein MSH2
VDNVTLRHSIREKVFKIFPDLLRYTKKLQQKKATLQDCYRIYQALQLVPVLNEGLSGYQGDHETLLDELFTTPLKERESDFVKYLELIESTLDADMIRHHEYLIKPSFDDELLS